MKRTNCWQPARRVWFQKNDDKNWEETPEGKDWHQHNKNYDDSAQGLINQVGKKSHGEKNEIKEIHKEIKRIDNYKKGLNRRLDYVNSY